MILRHNNAQMEKHVLRVLFLLFLGSTIWKKDLVFSLQVNFAIFLAISLSLGSNLSMGRAAVIWLRASNKQTSGFYGCICDTSSGARQQVETHREWLSATKHGCCCPGGAWEGIRGKLDCLSKNTLKRGKI